MNLKEKKRALRKLVEDAVAKAAKDGRSLVPGGWGTTKRRSDVCLVGAIGCYYKPKGFSPNEILMPEVVLPLIRNGMSEVIDDNILNALSHGFEDDPSTWKWERNPNGLPYYAYRLGRRIRREADKKLS